MITRHMDEVISKSQNNFLRFILTLNREYDHFKDMKRSNQLLEYLCLSRLTLLDLKAESMNIDKQCGSR